MPILQPARLGATMYYGGLRGLGLTALERRFRDAGLILCYHNVVSTAEAAVGDRGLHVPRERFERHMSWLRTHYTVVSMREFIDRMTTGRSLRSIAAVTFDDGYAGVFEHAVPILDALGIEATVFVVAEAVGRRAGFWWDRRGIVESATPARREKWLRDLQGDEKAIEPSAVQSEDGDLPASHRPADWASVCAALGRGIDVGVHSATHRSLPTLSASELEFEIAASRVTVREATGIWSDCFAYPYGHWDSRVRAQVQAAGYRAGLTLDDGLNGALADPWCLRRINIPAAISDAAFEAWTAGFRGRRRA